MREMDKVVKAQAGQPIVFIWKHNDQECPFIQFTVPKLVKSYADYAMIEQDLLSARECLKQIDLKNGNHIVLNSLLSNAITNYGRCFTKGEAKAVILDPNQVFKGKPTELNVHDLLMKLRHRFFAHSGGTEFETVMVYLALNPDKKSGPVEVYRGLIRTSSFAETFNLEAIAVINFVLDWVKVKIDTAHERMKELIAKQNINDLYGQSICPGTLGENVLRIYVE